GVVPDAHAGDGPGLLLERRARRHRRRAVRRGPARWRDGLGAARGARGELGLPCGLGRHLVRTGDPRRAARGLNSTLEGAIIAIPGSTRHPAISCRTLASATGGSASASHPRASRFLAMTAAGAPYSGADPAPAARSLRLRGILPR